jgi:hypothetical protein
MVKKRGGPLDIVPKDKRSGLRRKSPQRRGRKINSVDTVMHLMMG